MRVRRLSNPLARDPAGVDVTLVLAVDPEQEIIVGLDPLIYAELPMGVSGYYRDQHADAVLGVVCLGKGEVEAKDRPGRGLRGSRVNGRLSTPPLP